MITSYIKNFLLLLVCMGSFISSHAQYRVGDPGVIIDESKFDSDYPQMERWANAGVRGGIPFINSFDKYDTISAGSSAAINTAINAMAAKLSSTQKGLIILKNGIYAINARVNMKSRVSLTGESREGVKCLISMNSSDAFYFSGVNKCGLYNLTISGSWGAPKYLWNYSLDANRETSNENISVKLRGETTDCWLDKVTILNSAHDPLRCPSNHNTFRDLIVDGCFRKAGGAEGYFFIQGGDNLITGCQITHIRHISLQGGNVQYNVVYDNDFHQEISFHSGDNGNNLIANNRITLPVDMPPVAPGDADDVTPVEARNNKPTYFAVMGPWSIQHDVSSHPNFLYRNQCLQLNHNYGSATPWSDDNVVYYGPHKIGRTPDDHINNFPAYSAGVPDGGVLYAILLGDPIDATGVEISDTTISLQVNEKKMLSATVFPDSATNKSLSWISTNPEIASVDKGEIKGIGEGETMIIVKSNDGEFTDTCIVTVSGVLKIPVSGISLSNTSVNLMPGQTQKLVATVLPKDAYDKTVVWESEDTSVAAVEDGLVLAKDLGETIISAIAADGNKKAMCSLTVSNSITYVETFDELKLVGWGTETFTGNHGVAWTVTAKGISGDINGKGIYFHAGTTGITSGKISGGIGSFSVTCLNKWSDGIERTIQLFVNGELVASKKYTGDSKYTFEANTINVDGEFTMALKNASPDSDNNTISIDNITWTSYVKPDGISTIVGDIRAYPNPFTTCFTLKNAGDYNKAVLLDLSGKVIAERNINADGNLTLMPSYQKAPAGLYLLKLGGTNAMRTLKIVRQ